MNNKKEIIRISLILFIITAVSALILAYANKITSPLIEENQEKRTNISMKSVMPDAKDFEKSDFTSKSVDECYIAKDSNGAIIGACVVNHTNGYGGEIKVMTGINKDMTVSGIDILSNSETPGLGANATKDEFKDQFKGKKEDISVIRGTASGDENGINAISGATITSKAVTGAVNEAIKISADILK